MKRNYYKNWRITNRINKWKITLENSEFKKKEMTMHINQINYINSNQNNWNKISRISKKLIRTKNEM